MKRIGYKNNLEQKQKETDTEMTTTAQVTNAQLYK